jgi:hypothetical protein
MKYYCTFSSFTYFFLFTFLWANVFYQGKFSVDEAFGIYRCGRISVTKGRHLVSKLEEKAANGDNHVWFYGET